MLKKMSLLALAGIFCLQTQAQTDTTAKTPAKPADTMHIGNIIILKNGAPSSSSSNDWEYYVNKKRKSYPANIETEWVMVDLGFSNFNDKTNYASLTSGFGAGSNESWFNLRNGKSMNVNIWFVMQKLNVYKHVVNLKYGIGLELNNYMFDTNLRFDKNPARVYIDQIDYSKTKLAADYLTVPIMINFNFTPRNSSFRTFGVSAGISAGYLYSSRNKFVSSETGKDKVKGDLGLNDFKLAYIAEVMLGPIKLYGSYAFESMYKDGLDHTPYSFGIRLGYW
ncbi:outer membrane beta-barrel protein [Flavihumibacter petaseus]|uniref:Outer membrane protein beta-barrel domain-containing protein n=1 Tax=Flavihumibacter petaseus NBRC 106054 TaxID=1220578 RepID=A0A0E9N6E4_9BACT|nr:outer membrane beta-barrel protein [Flavihumibacter petaseus]GAO45296.1 hypothetical protein FPE01S_04_05400 [Flavihumibacter petaseus NBRC 106054]